MTKWAYRNEALNSSKTNGDVSNAVVKPLQPLNWTTINGSELFLPFNRWHRSIKIATNGSRAQQNASKRFQQDVAESCLQKHFKFCIFIGSWCKKKKRANHCFLVSYSAMKCDWFIWPFVNARRTRAAFSQLQWWSVSCLSISKNKAEQGTDLSWLIFSHVTDRTKRQLRDYAKPRPRLGGEHLVHQCSTFHIIW